MSLVTLLAWASPSRNKNCGFALSAVNLYNETKQPTSVYTPPTYQIDANTIKVDIKGFCWPEGCAFAYCKATHHKISKCYCILTTHSEHHTASMQQTALFKFKLPQCNKTSIISKYFRMWLIWGQGGITCFLIQQLSTITEATRHSITPPGENVPIVKQ